MNRMQTAVAAQKARFGGFLLGAAGWPYYSAIKALGVLASIARLRCHGGLIYGAVATVGKTGNAHFAAKAPPSEDPSF